MVIFHLVSKTKSFRWNLFNRIYQVQVRHVWDLISLLLLEFSFLPGIEYWICLLYFYSNLLTSTEPVKATLSISSWTAIALPHSGPSPRYYHQIIIINIIFFTWYDIDNTWWKARLDHHEKTSSIFWIKGLLILPLW